MPEDDKPKIEIANVGKVMQTECCFCGQKEIDVIASEINPKKTICFKCVYKINFQTGRIPAGAVYCFKCKSVEGFHVEMMQGKKHTFSVSGRDFKGCVKYVNKSDANLVKERIKKVTCAKCSGNIPRWALESTSHV